MRYLVLLVFLVTANLTTQSMATDILTNDELAAKICETRSKKDCKDTKKFMKVIESRKPAKRMVRELSGSAKLVADVQVHFSKTTKVIYVSFEDLINSVYEKSQTKYTRSGQFSSWSK